MWTRLGRIFAPPGDGWMASHAQNPMPEALGGSRFRVHFATRDARNRARGGYFDFDIESPGEILGVSDAPTLDLGELGAFDDAGVMPSSLIEVGGVRWMYYTGWSKTVDVPFAFHIGLAQSDDGGRTYRRYSRAPVLGRNQHDPFITGAPCVMREDGRWRMWYIAATKWEAMEGGKPVHYYTVKHAESADGITWLTSDALCIPYGPGEYAIARPIVFRQDDGYEMWFTFRGGSNTYRVGTARSSDGITWVRDAAPLGIEPADAGWDSGMICYAHPLEYGGRRYALYNGSDYGRTGIGLAVQEDR